MRLPSFNLPPVRSTCVKVYPEWYTFSLYLGGAVLLLFLVAGIVAGVLSKNILWLLPSLAAGIAYTILSIKVVHADEVAGIMVFGKPALEPDAGPILVFLGIASIKRLPRAVQQLQYPADDENQIFRQSDDEPLPPGMVRPIRITTGNAGRRTKNSSPLEGQMSIEVTWFTRFSIESFFDFWVNIGSVEEAGRQIDDTGKKVLAKLIGARTPAKIVAELKEINTELSAKLQEDTKTWGILLRDADMLSPDPGRSVSKSLAKNITSQAETIDANAVAAQTIITGEAERKRLIAEGEGHAAAEKALLTARAAGFKEIRESAGVSGETVLASEVARDIFKDANGTIIGAGDGVRDVMGILKAFGVQSGSKGGDGGKRNE